MKRIVFCFLALSAWALTQCGSFHPQAFQTATSPAGTAATISVGSTTTLAPGSPASVTNSGTSSNAVFNFAIPQGEMGPSGPTGPQGEPGAAGGAAPISYWSVCGQSVVGATQAQQLCPGIASTGPIPSTPLVILQVGPIATAGTYLVQADMAVISNTVLHCNVASVANPANTNFVATTGYLVDIANSPGPTAISFPVQDVLTLAQGDSIALSCYTEALGSQFQAGMTWAILTAQQITVQQ